MTSAQTLRQLSSHSSRKRPALAAAALAALLLFAPGLGRAFPVNGQYSEDARCDVHPNQSVSHEIGETLLFPIDERILVVSSAIPAYACVADDGAPNDFFVQMTNLSPYAYTDLFFVADSGILIGNADGSMEDLLGAPGVLADAFKIDGTVTLGVNNTLQQESGIVNEIFEPGETWRFLVTNVLFPANVPPLLVFDSVGGFAGSSLGFPPSTASIVGTQIVPEPSSLILLAGGLSALAAARRRSA